MRHFTDDDAKEYVNTHLKNENDLFKEIISVKYKGTIAGQEENCGGCTLMDGQDCTPPKHYMDVFLIEANDNDNKKHAGYLHMGWSDGGPNCINAYGDYNKMWHQPIYEK
ncbi:hypothetical protein [Methanimicrococcus blatticola]|uniref:Uncharacterized protein n=1 Tax=Methanimicrococcus blatticola TaxID=91560 RepID=A0A484F6C6_9EURY|nr:hypothetical protein [Methanimicrococcus blatticola]MBZ3935853.1 hypothetical protein [Methanimicrococcus blatticola]MCC2508026.1 hypothetical protein [Methanimicrococcus blatticola]TDQ68890.1 hypothetical protein C7391_1089 [Methanimicrococcus blatticola]